MQLVPLDIGEQELGHEGGNVVLCLLLGVPKVHVPLVPALLALALLLVAHHVHVVQNGELGEQRVFPVVELARADLKSHAPRLHVGHQRQPGPMHANDNVRGGRHLDLLGKTQGRGVDELQCDPVVPHVLLQELLGLFRHSSRALPQDEHGSWGPLGGAVDDVAHAQPGQLAQPIPREGLLRGVPDGEGKVRGEDPRHAPEEHALEAQRAPASRVGELFCRCYGRKYPRDDAFHDWSHEVLALAGVRPRNESDLVPVPLLVFPATGPASREGLPLGLQLPGCSLLAPCIW